MIYRSLITVLIIILCGGSIPAQDSLRVLDKVIDKSKISGQWFLAYDYDIENNQSSFLLKRGYFNVKTKLNKLFSVRYTQDITIDREGSDAGNVEIRLKYLYLKLKPQRFKLLRNSYFELGLAHRPWLDYEQSINRYRVQGRMFAEETGLISSADLGIFYTTLLGGKIKESYLKKSGDENPGKYGSFSAGIFNGGGYHALENNNNKTLEARLSLRLFPARLPGIRLSYTGAYGKANTPNNLRDFRMNLLMLSSQSRYHAFTAQYTFGIGDHEGIYYLPDNSAYAQRGYSFFGEFKLPNTQFAAFGRADFFSVDAIGLDFYSYTGGVSYTLFAKNKIVAHYTKGSRFGLKHELIELALEIAF